MVVGPAPVRAHLMSLLMRPTAAPLATGAVIAVSLIVAQCLLVYLLKQVASGNAFGVVYLIGVLPVSTVWAFGMALATSVASALALDHFRSAVERAPLANRHLRQSRLVAGRSLSGSGAGDQHAHGGSA
jgi:membrane protein implicated in regulation of membrane protease activity